MLWYYTVLGWLLWLDGWAEPLVAAAKEVLPDEWLDCIAWPIRQG